MEYVVKQNITVLISQALSLERRDEPQMALNYYTKAKILLESEISDNPPTSPSQEPLKIFLQGVSGKLDSIRALIEQIQKSGQSQLGQNQEETKEMDQGQSNKKKTKNLKHELQKFQINSDQKFKEENSIFSHISNKQSELVDLQQIQIKYLLQSMNEGCFLSQNIYISSFIWKVNLKNKEAEIECCRKICLFDQISEKINQIMTLSQFHPNQEVSLLLLDFRNFLVQKYQLFQMKKGTSPRVQGNQSLKNGSNFFSFMQGSSSSIATSKSTSKFVDQYINSSQTLLMNILQVIVLIKRVLLDETSNYDSLLQNVDFIILFNKKIIIQPVILDLEYKFHQFLRIKRKQFSKIFLQ